MIGNATNSPDWNEKLVLNEDYLHIVQNQVLILFEILDFTVPKSSQFKQDLTY